jgi:Family of unknown function (DUF6304)
MDRYTGKYTDARGSESITICNDSLTLSVNIRGVEFAGTDLDALSPSVDATADQLRVFSLHRNDLCSCSIECEMPISIHDDGHDGMGALCIKLRLGEPAPNGGLDREELLIVLTYNERRFAGSGLSGWFEDELIAIQQQLPNGVYLKACINCLFSDYSPLGHGSFGQLRCFRNLKQDYLKVRSKAEFWPLHDRYDRLVQETYVCPDFQRRVAGVGYRG